MTPCHCRVRHDPPHTYGDCVRACVASLMDLQSEEVPHFYHDNAPGDVALGERFTDWLAARGYTPFFVGYDGSMTCDEVLAGMAELNSTVHYMLFGSTESGGHVVVCRGGAIVHDPSWYSSPLVGPGKDGMWAVCAIVRQ